MELVVNVKPTVPNVLMLKLVKSAHKDSPSKTINVSTNVKMATTTSWVYAHTVMLPADSVPELEPTHANNVTKAGS